MNNTRSSNCVSFADVSVRNYDMCIGDSPSVMVGAPLSLDWTYSESFVVSVDQFESARPGPKRTKEEMRMTAYERHQKLMKDFGYSSGEIKQAVRRRVVSRGGKRLSPSPMMKNKGISQSGDKARKASPKRMQFSTVDFDLMYTRKFSSLPVKRSSSPMAA